MKALRETTDTYPDYYGVRIETGQEPVEAEIKISLIQVEATDLEANPEEKDTVAEQQEVPKEETAMKTFGALKKRHGDRHLAVGRHRKPKKQTHGDGGSRKKLDACRGMIRRAIPARHKGHCRQGQGKDKVVPRTQK
jgi:hypothetical protein